METRDELLRAAARVYALHGYRGSTTRRIADEAGVNEITIFRQFGTKDALIHEAIASCGGNQAPEALPAIPVDPAAELQVWARQVRLHINTNRSLIRRCMSEREEHPQLIATANQGPIRAAMALREYLGRLYEHGFVDEPFDTRAPTAMLIGTLFADSMGRDVMPEIYPPTADGAVAQYTQLLLRAVGVDTQPIAARAARQPQRSAECHTMSAAATGSATGGATDTAISPDLLVRTAHTAEHPDQ